ncbi:MAG: DUF2442 domain-containing protein [Alphaproteobacteria bacterium]|nr:DUF2442 domain-containing protein [Alphaproteobacteria bacterium]
MNSGAKRDLPRVASVRVIGPNQLEVKWADGARDRVDLSGWIASAAILRAILTAEAFRTPRVVDGGVGLEWPGGADISAARLREIAEAQRPFRAKEFRMWLDRHGVSVRAAAELFGLGARTIENYRSGASEVPATLAIACRAMDSNDSLFMARFRPRRTTGRPRKTSGSAHAA